ncbi:LemA family protein [[Acholeplasma] multilocale]|uniref:LemA family protein n=1 Tax=[Acholeplasma] multilocale TaxID=264638 RepID=UPI00047BA45D|nr:LemA family protein [[Acholeplasma] multilocale]
MPIKEKNTEKQIKTNMAGKVIWYGSFVLIIPLISHISRRNNIIRFQEKIYEASSGIDVHLVKRTDTLLKLVDVVKSTIKFEKELLTKLVELRNIKVNDNKIQDNILLNEKLSTIQRYVGIQMEAYPELKSNKNILDLQQNIREVEDDLTSARRIYNANVTAYNQFVQTWPTAVVAESIGVFTKPFFKATKEQKQDIKIVLGI